MTGIRMRHCPRAFSPATATRWLRCSGPIVLTTVLSASLVPNASAQDDGGAAAASSRVAGWTSWRGPYQDGTSHEKGLPKSVSLDKPGSWSIALKGRGTPTIANGRVYALGYEGSADTLQELLVCLDEESGKKIWERRFTDYLSDVIYSRYSIGSPTVDPETGNVFIMTTPGLLCCITPDGDEVWRHSMIEEYGRLTFPNGRTGAVLIDGPRAIVHVISSGWGPQGPARDRFFAFDKKTGVNLWSSTPGGPPKDSSFSFPVVGEACGRRMLYATLGGGNLVAVDVRTGDPVWRYQMSIGGMNSNALLVARDDGQYDVIAIHGKENLDSSVIGRMVRVRHPNQEQLADRAKLPLVLDKSCEVWRNDLVSFTSSPVLVGQHVFQTTQTGDLHCVDTNTGKTLWHVKLAADQIHASPVFGDGKLYVPMNDGSFHVLMPDDSGPNVLQTLQLEGNCLGAPAIANGRIYVHTTEKLYCFAGGRSHAEPVDERPDGPGVGEIAQIQVRPADQCAHVGQTVEYRVVGLDSAGRVVADSIEGAVFDGGPSDGAEWDGSTLRIAANAKPCAVTMKVSALGKVASARLRIVPFGEFGDDFEVAKLAPGPDGVPVGNPRPFWVGAGKKWEIRETESGRVLAKTLANPLFQRSLSYIGHPDQSNYTMQVDIKTDGNRRILSTAGVIHQRYQIALKGNHQQLEISSNMERFKKDVPFKWKPGVWYRLKTRVDVAKDGSGVIRAKAWPRDEPEPADWTIQAADPVAHRNGAPGIYGFVPQSRFRVYLDNLKVIPND
ncbi:MAG: PQQ-binding-like beta-propeller repeat protein [Planctomycetes bacterium]|nr:PQQ-binding-like beta-propeller repeat protein [Planctomycetota bacterium]